MIKKSTEKWLAVLRVELFEGSPLEDTTTKPVINYKRVELSGDNHTTQDDVVTHDQ